MKPIPLVAASLGAATLTFALTGALTGADQFEPPAVMAPVAPVALVSAQRGNLPIIITAPHGGMVRVPGSKDRSKAGGAVVVRDEQTAQVAHLVAQRVTDKLGGKPFVIIAQFSRKDADANRAPGEAYENEAAKSEYDAFHAQVAGAVAECKAAFGHAILIDLHGQAKEPGAIVRGTRNGQTVKTLLAKHGNGALVGPDSVFGRLKAAGYQVLPELGKPEDGLAKETFFEGGYIVGHYGSNNDTGVDAIQIEMGKQRQESPMKLSEDVGDAIAGFYKAYLAPKPAPKQPV